MPKASKFPKSRMDSMITQHGAKLTQACIMVILKVVRLSCLMTREMQLKLMLLSVQVAAHLMASVAQNTCVILMKLLV